VFNDHRFDAFPNHVSYLNISFPIEFHVIRLSNLHVCSLHDEMEQVLEATDDRGNSLAVLSRKELVGDFHRMDLLLSIR